MITLRVFSILCLAVLLVFGGLLRAPFHFDDHSLFTHDAVTSPSGWWTVWKPIETRPLTYFTYWLNHQLGGSDPLGYHAVNLALHVAAALLILNVLSRLIPRSAALIAAVVFALHPIQTEAVAYVFARGTLLAAVLCLLSLRSWLAGKLWTAVVWFGLAMLAKAECAAFPVFLWLLHWTASRERRERVPIAVMLGIAVAGVARVALAAAMVQGSGAGMQAGVGAWEYFLTQGTVIPRYLRLLVMPVGLTVDPAIDVVTDWRAWAGWAMIAAVVAVALKWFPGAGEGFWFVSGLVLLAPTSSVFPAADLAADRRLYLPMLAFSALAGLLCQRLPWRPAMVSAGVILAGLSWARAEVWRSERALWQDAMEKAPQKVRPRVQLARVSPPDRATELLHGAQRIAPDNATVAAELGKVFLSQDRYEEALREFGRAAALAPGDAKAWNNRGVALLKMGLSDAAIEDFRRALAIDPSLAEARQNLRLLGALPEAKE